MIICCVSLGPLVPRPICGGAKGVAAGGCQSSMLSTAASFKRRSKKDTSMATT